MLPLAGLLLNMGEHQLYGLALSLLIGVPSLVLLGGIVAAVTIAVQRGTALLTLLLTPFYIPILIFAVGVMMHLLQPNQCVLNYYWRVLFYVFCCHWQLITAAALNQAD